MTFSFPIPETEVKSKEDDDEAVNDDKERDGDKK